MKKVVSLLALSLLFLPGAALAFCPVCTIAVGAGIGFSRYLGIDDTITGLWVGGLLISLSMWTIDWLEKKRKKTSLSLSILIFVLYYALVLIPLYYTNFIGHPLNRFWGLDKLILGTLIGSIFFFAAGAWYQYLKKRNGNKPHFPWQKVIMPVSTLIILSFIFYFITR